MIDEMRARLESAPPGVVGLVVSISGFSPKVIERVERSAERPILLMDGDEVEQVVARGGGVYTLVRSKMDRFLRDRKAVVGLSSQTAPLWMRELPEAGLKIVDLEGREHSWWESKGDFSQQVSSLLIRSELGSRWGNSPRPGDGCERRQRTGWATKEAGATRLGLNRRNVAHRAIWRCLEWIGSR